MKKTDLGSLMLFVTFHAAVPKENNEPEEKG